jgi:phage tail protein X
MVVYKTKQLEVIDWICWKHYGFTSGSVEHVIRENPEIAEYDDYLPEGLLVNLPEISKEKSVKQVKLWD